MKIRKELGDFKHFIMRGNVIDLAVGVIVGSAFGKIVTSLVNDVLMPFIGLMLGKTNLAGLEVIIQPGNEKDNIAALALKYGSFLQSIIDFLIIAFCVYLFIRLIERFRHKQEKPVETPAPARSEALLAEIRDLLKEKK